MNEIKITGYYYRKKYDCKFITFTYNGNEYLTNGDTTKPLTERHRKSMLELQPFDTSEIQKKLKYHGNNAVLTEALRTQPVAAKNLNRLTVFEAEEMGFRRFYMECNEISIPEENRIENLWLIPAGTDIPIGTTLTSIENEEIVYDGNNIDKNDTRYGFLPYGVIIPDQNKEKINYEENGI